MNGNIYIGELIFQKLKEKQRSVAWLAKQTGCDDSNLLKMLKGERYINTDLLFQFSIALEEDLFAYYSNKLNEILSGQIDQTKQSN